MSKATLEEIAGVSTRSLVDRVVRLVESASPSQRDDGLYWYSDMHVKVCKLVVEHGTDVRVAAGVLAALSPRCPVSLNLRWTEETLQSGTAVGNMGAHRAKAGMILNGAGFDVLGTRKVRHFAHCVADPTDEHHVAVDTWAVRALGLTSERDYKRITGDDTRYEQAADIYRKAAKRLGLRPHEAQAIAWVVIRGASW